MNIDELLCNLLTNDEIAADIDVILEERLGGDARTRAIVVQEIRDRLLAEWMPYAHTENSMEVDSSDLYLAVSFLTHLSYVENWPSSCHASEVLRRLTDLVGEVVPSEGFSWQSHNRRKVDCICTRWGGASTPSSTDECPWCRGSQVMDLFCTHCGGYGVEPVLTPSDLE